MNGSIIIAHAATDQRHVHTEECLRTALAPGQDYEIVRVEPARQPLCEFDASFNWAAAAREQCEQLRAGLRAARARHPDYSIVYCGFVPIPLAFHLGICVGQTFNVEIRLLQHFENHWRWPSSGLSPNLGLSSAIRGTREDLDGDVPIRVWTSVEIKDDDVEAALPSLPDTTAGARIWVPDPRPRARLTSPEDLQAVADEFYAKVYELGRSRTRHLFAAVPTGLAFRMGTMLNETIDLPIQTWKWLGPGVGYVKALRIELRAAPEVLILAASPPDAPSISASAEAEELQDIARCRRIRAPALDEVNPRALVRALRERQPAAIHFAGHGRPRAGVVDDGSGDLVRNFAAPSSRESALILHGEKESSSVTGSELRRLFQDEAPRLVVITACYSKDLADALVGVVECVVGFNGRLNDSDARRFAEVFWRALFDGASVQSAFLDGQLQLPEADRHAGKARLLPRDDADPATMILFPSE